MEVGKTLILEVGGGDHHSGRAADGPDAVLFKLATFIHMYFCILHFDTPLGSSLCRSTRGNKLHSESIHFNSLGCSMLSWVCDIGLELLGC